MSEDFVLIKFEFVLEAVQQIEEWFADIAIAQDFLNTSIGRSHYAATVLKLQTICESLKKIDAANPKVLLSHPEVEWNEIMRLRELISHHYEKLSNEVVYDSCKYDLPILKKAVEEIIEELKQGK